MVGEIREISYQIAVDFLLPKHYSGRVPSISIAFGWYIDGILKAVCTFGKPASRNLCVGVCGKEYSKNVYELNRLCRTDDLTQPLSHLVGYCLRKLKSFDWIIVSYSDTAMNHSGYIYQACNFIYTGQTKPRTDIYTGNKKHSRHYTQTDRESNVRVLRSSKNRYIYFCTTNKQLKKMWQINLKYDVQPYPKAQNKNYELGEFIKPTLIIKSIRNSKTSTMMSAETFMKGGGENGNNSICSSASLSGIGGCQMFD